MQRFKHVTAMIGLLASVDAVAAEKSPPRPALLDKLVTCKTISDASQRLACYDMQVSAIDAAEKSQDLVVLDRDQVRETRRSLFGFTLPRFSLGGRKFDEKDEIQQIDSAIQSSRRVGYEWVIVLINDNGTWQTSEQLTRTQPKAGVKVRIRKGAMGGYLASIGDNQGVRMRRVE